MSSTMKVAAEAGRLKREGVDVVDFGAGEPDFPTPDNIKQAAINAINDNFTRYTPAGGTAGTEGGHLRAARLDFGTGYKPSECVVAVGGKHAIFNLHAGPDQSRRRGHHPRPLLGDLSTTWSATPEASASSSKPMRQRLCHHGRDDRDAPHGEDQDDPDQFAVQSQRRHAGREEFERIYGLTSKRGIWHDDRRVLLPVRVRQASRSPSRSMPGAKDTVIVVGSLSKTYAMTGWRIGFALSPAPLAKALGSCRASPHRTRTPSRRRRP